MLLNEKAFRDLGDGLIFMNENLKEALTTFLGIIGLLVFLFLAYKFYTNFVKPTFSGVILTYQIYKTNKNETKRRCAGLSSSAATDFAAEKLYDSCMKKAGYWIY